MPRGEGHSRPLRTSTRKHSHRWNLNAELRARPRVCRRGRVRAGTLGFSGDGYSLATPVWRSTLRKALMADRIGTKAAWLSGLIGVALLAAVVAVALHASDAEAFARLIERAQPAWLAAALGLQMATYLAGAEIWRCVTRAAGMPLRVGLAYRLSVVELLVDQALPSSGLSGSVVVAGALQRRGIGKDVTTAGIVVNAVAYLMAYIAALGAGIAVLTAQGRATAPVLVAGGAFILAAAVVAAGAI